MTRKDGQLTPPVGQDDHVQGAVDAPTTLVEYGDYECPHCGRAYPIVKRIQSKLGDNLRFVFRNFPLSQIHPNAADSAAFAEAAALQGKFWSAHDILFENQRVLSAAALARYARDIGLEIDAFEKALLSGGPAQRVGTDFRNGIRSGVNGTPTFFINGARFDGNWSDEGALTEALSSSEAHR
jgi:protein-disulfide isomerase